MEKISVTNSFNKSLEVLKTTECSSKDKLHHFNNLSECLANPHLQTNYQHFLRPAIGVLILYCEDMDSSARMCAHENLVRILRYCEQSQQQRKVIVDLYHEIKKNGNERSLRVCLSLFAYLIHHITQKRSRVYLQNIIPCLHAICERRETMLLESFTEFLNPLFGHLGLCINESEAMRLIDVFLTNLTVGCATKRRCMAQNTLTLLQSHRKRHQLSVYALTRSMDVLVKNRDEVNTTLGVLGLWRLLIPVCLTEMEEINCEVQEKLLEIFDLCIQYLLSCPNHSIINATLEVLITLTANLEHLPKWQRSLCDDPNDLLSKRNSLKMIVCGKEAQIMSPEDTVIVTMDSSNQIALEMIDSSMGSVDEMDTRLENLSLQSIKSSDSSSLGGFFNQFLPGTSDFFRGQKMHSGSSSVQATPIHEPNNSVQPLSPSLEAEVLNYTPGSTKSAKSDWCAMEFRDCPVFGISDLNTQSILSYSIRVLCSKYLLTGRSQELIADGEVRVSTKHLALVVLGNILCVSPQLFLQPLNLSVETENFDIDCAREKEDDLLLHQDTEQPVSLAEEKLLEIKEDHFGPSSANIANYLTPLSQSVDGSLTGRPSSAVDSRMSQSDYVVANNDTQIRLRVKRIKQSKESDQFIYEVLLLRTHSDPMLRGDVVFVVQCFLKGICITQKGGFQELLDEWKVGKNALVEFQCLWQVIVNGLGDEHHSVVKCGLAAVQGLLECLAKCVSSKEETSKGSLLIRELLSVADKNPYWLIKSNLCEVLPNLINNLSSKVLDDKVTKDLQLEVSKILLKFLGDDDHRIRLAAAAGLLDLVRIKRDDLNSHPLKDHIQKRVFENLPNRLLQGSIPVNVILVKQLLFDLSNQLLEVQNKNITSGVLLALVALTGQYPPAENWTVWKDHNLVAILESGLKSNPHVIFDTQNHTVALKVYTALLAGQGVIDNVGNDDLHFLLTHTLQMMNIYGHVVNSQKPLIKDKTDLFMSEKELQKTQMKGYFGSSPVYLKIYKTIKATHDTFKININREVEDKLRDLLEAVVGALNLVLELKPIVSMSQSTQLVDEILVYLDMLFVFAPITVIVVAKFLFKYFFERNYAAQREEYRYFRGINCESNPREVMLKIAEFNVMRPGEFYQEEESHIKLFESMVIRSLRTYMRVEPRYQSEILGFICQLLTLNVNYAMLDSNLEFFKFVQEQLDAIETGRVKEAELLIGNLLRFLFLLNNKKLISNPKIIHMTDNLLANQNIRECSLTALVQLSEELFLNGATERVDVEANTEKEFIFSILMKFVNYSVVQRFVILVLKCSEGSAEVYRDSVVEGVLTAIEKYQSGENETMEAENLSDLLGCLSLSDSVSNVEQIKSILVKFNFDKEIVLVECQLFLVVVKDFLFKGRESKIEDIFSEPLVGKLIEMQLSFTKQSSVKLPLNLLKESFIIYKNFHSDLLSLLIDETRRRIRFTDFWHSQKGHADVFLFFADYWVEIGVISGYKEVVKVLRDDLVWDSTIKRDLLKKIILKSKVTEEDTDILLSNYLMAMELLENDHTILNQMDKTKVFLEVIKLVYSSNFTSSIKRDVVVLDYCKKLLITEDFCTEVIPILINYLINSRFALVKKRCRNIILSLKSSDPEKIDRIVNQFPELLNFSWLAKDPCEKISSQPIDSFVQEIVDDNWVWTQIRESLHNDPLDCDAHVQMLLTFKSDMKTAQLLSQLELTPHLCSVIIRESFKHMRMAFGRDCITYNPHITYLLVPFPLKFILERLVLANSSDEDILQPKWTEGFLLPFLKGCQQMQKIALKQIELRLFDRFMSDNLLKPSVVDCMLKLLALKITEESGDDALEVVNLVLGNVYIFRMWDSTDNYYKYLDVFVAVVHFVYRVGFEKMRHSAWIRGYKGIDGLFNVDTSDQGLLQMYSEVTFLIKLREELSNQMPVGTLLQVIQNLVRFHSIYPMAVIPHKYLRTVCDNVTLQDHHKCPVPMMSIADLRDSDTLKDFVANVKAIGFTTRQQFEEYLMTLLVLLNTEFEESEYDFAEQYVIRRTCLCSITELLVTIKGFPVIGSPNRSFSHTTRNDPIPIYMIHLKKLSEILNLLPGSSPLDSPNLEKGTWSDENCSSHSVGFSEGQFSLTTIWQGLEEEASEAAPKQPGIYERNCSYNLEWFEIDYNSSVKMVLEMSTQMYELHGERYLAFYLPCMVRLTELFVSRDQYKWLREIVFKLHQTIPAEDANCHQYLVYLMCKTSAVLVPGPTEINYLSQTVLVGYLKSRSHNILTATLKGLLVLFESCVLHNSTIGKLNEEILQLRKLVLGYADSYFAVEKEVAPHAKEGKFEEHDRVLWALIFYTLEKTLKLTPDCLFVSRMLDHLGKTMRTINNIEIFSVIVNGIQRLILTNCISSVDVTKFEKMALDLVKTGDEESALTALKLLATCLYIGSVDELEKTQKSNGVVQDEPETILRMVEKVDVLFGRIKVAPPATAAVYAQVLSIIIRDLLPAKDVLTKAIKELMISQPVVAKILFQVFRSSIDADYLPLMQDWLVSSLSNFLGLPEAKSIWCLTVIFISASVNIHLLKTFPHLLLIGQRLPPAITPRMIHMFAVASKNFYDKLSKSQKPLLLNSFATTKHTVIREVGKRLD